MDDIIRDGALVCGTVLIGVGCWWISPALALVVVGLIVLALTVAGYLRPQPPRERDE